MESVDINSRGGSKIRLFIVDPSTIRKSIDSTSNQSSSSRNYKKQSSHSPHYSLKNESISEDGAGEIFPKKITLTTFGRLSKPPAALLSSPQIAETSLINSRKRRPPEFFKCVTCCKFYVGTRRLKAHFHKHPSHEPSEEFSRSLRMKSNIVPHIIEEDELVINERVIPIPLLSEINSNSPQEASFSDGLLDNNIPTSQKTIWHLVEEKLALMGVNQILLELSDVAERLGKIARDKIIPIREDEEERLSSSLPIVRVENPFLSHLLDLPFGNYVFREDGGTRRNPLPPPTTDLSLTAGEVDIDKFLSRNMDIDLSLPHLTNLDIASICNNS